MSEDITRADLEYMFNTAAEKFFKEFKAARIEPVININSGSTSVKEISKQLAQMFRESADSAAGGCYSETFSRATMAKQIKRSELIKEIHDAVIESLSSSITIDLDVPSASCKIGYPVNAAERAAENVIKRYIGDIQVID
ncbi:hypothetical protein EQM14_01615 [Caproiciproducens sp. NJN-50]|uniref:hypothetical protein n=1 Tax=Caproiciproducens sp. NJN-50 TaxID=2507162 RepID=UPI000FFE2281|nr:hypothetical protein [Caproiciproducens sp. NJN-50]QAT48581.1 hypothetical protein EQM14_01615 [Caproiciproducens sp. NJN-50]